MRYIQTLGLFSLVLLPSAAGAASHKAARPSKRSYNEFDYYVLEHDPSFGLSVQECALALGADVVEQAGELIDHWLIRARKSESGSDLVLRAFDRLDLDERASLGRRDPLRSAVRHVTKQTLRQRVKRAPTPAPPPITSGDSVALAREIAARLGIQDPLFRDQWHLINDEYPDHMVNATPVWDLGITGKGVTSCLVDDGLDYQSEDLKDNFDAAGSYDFNDHEELPTPKLSDDHHGTRCAGEIAAVRNGVCGVGIAYESKVAGVRILSGPISDVDEAAALNYAYQDTQIYSCSWGPPDDGRSMDAPSILIQKAMLNGVQNGRGGKGSVFVFASGNGGSHGDQCNFDGYTNSIYSVTVASIDYKGEHPPYSEQCAANLVTTYSSGTNIRKAIVTTDVGTNKCTRSHGGTSAAAPNAVGIFALALSIRPDLTWRDIQHLCVKTAKVISPGDDSWELTAAGQPFSYKFGYGKLDAYDFVTAAQDWDLVKPQAWIEAPIVQLENGKFSLEHKFTGGVKLTQDGVESTFEVTSEMLEESNFETLEHVTVRVWIEHSRRGHVAVSLTSPNGIRSMLAEPRNVDKDKNGFPGWRFMTVKHWGEYPVGTWTISVSDQGISGESGRFIGWDMSLWGSARDVTKAKSYVLRNSEELPIPFPPPLDEALPEPTPSTTKSYLKPTVVSSTAAQDDVESATGSTTPDGSESMSDQTRTIISAIGSTVFVLLLAGAAFLVVRRVHQNRIDASLRDEGREAEGEEVNMRLLDRNTVLYDEDEDESDGEDASAVRSTLGNNHAAFQSGFLHDEGMSDGESETTVLPTRR